ncbi:MAG: deoxyribodipyrimidine photo-lyase, partial [Acholeplasmataceae bacterium]|nr:deoxyribodipyrimidine photo-lyase [Acholeplasmataceae bacterium]
MHPNRIICIQQNKRNVNEHAYALYWMQQSQRVHFNHALKHAIDIANQKRLPLVVYFGLWSGYPDANLRHFKFMLEGLKEVKEILLHFSITFVLKIGKPEEEIMPLLKDAYHLVMDQGYLKHQKSMRSYVINLAPDDLGIDIVDTDLVVPVHIASQKVEYGAYTIRPKLKKLIPQFRDFKQIEVLVNKQRLNISSDDSLTDIDLLLEKLNLDRSVKPSEIYHGGYLAAS